MRKILICAVITCGSNLAFAQADCGVTMVGFGSDPVCNNDPWVLVFEDNFEGIELDQTKWLVPYQGMVRDFSFSSSKQWNANSGITPSILISNNIAVSNGTLKLIARKETTPISGTYVSNWATTPPTTQTSSFNYSSGELETQEYFGFGKYEIRCKLPKGKGFFPAFWTYGDPYMNEIDIFEFWNENNCFGSYDADRLSKNPHFNFHNDYAQDGQSESCPSDLYAPCSTWNGPDYSEGFHTFTMIWNFYKIEWYIDGALKRKSTRYGDYVTDQARDCYDMMNGYIYNRRDAFPLNYDQKIIVDLAIKSGGDAPDANTPFPSQLEIDYIKYYKQNPCVGNQVYSSTSALDLSTTLFNVKIGKTITLQTNVTLASNMQLELLAYNEIVLNPGFETMPGSLLETKLDGNICTLAGLMQNDPVEFREPVEFAADAAVAALEEKGAGETLNIYPNPARDAITIEYTEPGAKDYYIVLLDNSGRRLLSLNGQEKTTLDLSGFNAGIYFLRIYDNRGDISVTKIIKEQ